MHKPPLFREQIAQFYSDCKAENITVTNGGSEANYVTLWTLLEPGGRLACMIPNYMQAWGLGRAYAGGVDSFQLVKQKEAGTYCWRLDVEGLKRAVTPKTNVLLITNPNNPTGAILTADEMDAVVDIASKAGAFVYCEYNLPINSTELINRLRVEQSVLFTAGDQHGLDKGIRTGFGIDVKKTLKGLDCAEALMRSLK